MTANVVALLPNAGLANKLFVWAKAEVFAEHNGLTASAVGWTYPKLGPLIRGERSSRQYGRYITSSTASALGSLASGWINDRIVTEPPCERLGQIDPRSTFLFRRVPHWSDMFDGLKGQRRQIRSKLLACIKEEHSTQLRGLSPPQIAIHVRRGDFRPLEPDEDFSRVGGVRTPSQYFLNIAVALRSAAGGDVPITVFSDGTDAELSFLLNMPRTARSRAPNDIADLITMSRSKVIVTSAGSTFSDWAGFLSDASIIRHPDHIHSSIRAEADLVGLHEGRAPATDDEWRILWNKSSRSSRDWLAKMGA